MLLRSSSSSAKLTIPTIIIKRSQSNLTSSSSSPSPSNNNSSIPSNFHFNTTLQLKLLKAALFGPLDPFPSNLASNQTYQSTYRAQEWRETKRRGYENLNRLEKKDDFGNIFTLRGNRALSGIGRSRGSVPKLNRGLELGNRSRRREFSTSVTTDQSQQESKQYTDVTYSRPQASEQFKSKGSRPRRKTSNSTKPSLQSSVPTLPAMSAEEVRRMENRRVKAAKEALKLSETFESGPVLGDWVEIRTKGVASSGIYLGPSAFDATRSVLRSSSSTFSLFLPNDITFVIPSLVALPLATLMREASIPTFSDESEAPILNPKAEQVALTFAQILRKLDTRVEEARMEIVQLGASELYRFYTQTGGIVGGQATKEKVSTPKALVDLFNGHPLPPLPPLSSLQSTPPSQIYKLALHQILMESPLHFICDPVSHRTSSTFKIRPLEELESFELVRGWVRNRSPELESFARKAVVITQWGEQHAVEGGGGIPILKNPNGNELTKWELPSWMEWTKTDLEIIQFLRLSLTSQRLIQLQPYLSISPGILKIYEQFQQKFKTKFDAKSQRQAVASTEPVLINSLDTSTESITSPISSYINTSRSDVFNRERIMSFLISIGIVPPWENWAAHSYSPLAARSISTESDSLASKALETAYNDLPAYNDGLDNVRRDFGSQMVFTIDDPGAMELDDGISIEECSTSSYPEEQSPSWWIHVHVADPTSVLSPNHEVAQLARKRFQTIYLPEATFPMLPNWFIEKEKLSLGSSATTGEEQKVLTFSTRVNELGFRLEGKVSAGIVRNVKRLTYAAVDKVLGFEKGPEPVVLSLFSSEKESQDDTSTAPPPSSSLRHTDDATLLTNPSALADLQQLHILARAVMKDRARLSLFWNYPAATTSVSPTLSHQFTTNSAPSFYSNHPSISLTLPTQGAEGSLTFSQTIVSEFMVLANRTAARFCAENKIPVPFRSQVAPSSNPTALKKLLDLRDPNSGLVKGEDVLKYDINFDAAVTTTYPLPHWPMGIHDKFGYVKVTSPLRRYSDMLCHWQIKSALSTPLPSPNSTSSTTSTTSNSKRAAAEERPHQLVPFFEQHVISAESKHFEQSDRLQKNLDKSGNSFWAHYLIKSKLELSPGVDTIADKVLSNLTCLGLRVPIFSLSEGFWSQRVLIMELGIRGQLELGDSGVGGAVVGERVNCRIKEIILSENSRCWVTLRK